MNKDELAYLTSQLMQAQGIDKAVINEAVQTFLNTEKVSSLEYSEQGLTNYNKLISDWKETKIGQKFLPVEQQPKSSKQLTTKEIVAKLKDGSIKFNSGGY